MRNSVKPLTHWVIYKGYTVRFRTRSSEELTGRLTTPNGVIDFHYNPHTMVIRLPDTQISINEFGWELDRTVVVEDETRA